MKNKIVSIFLLLFILSTSLKAQLRNTSQLSLSQYKMKVYTDKDGLPNNGALFVKQTNDKYIWIGTYNGLIQFDGVQKTFFTPSNTKEIHGRVFQAMLEDKDTLWIGTQGGLSKETDEDWSSFRTQEGLPSNIIASISKDQKGKIWVGTSNGLAFYAPHENKFITEGITPELQNTHISTIYSSKNDVLWVGTNTKGLYGVADNKLINFNKNNSNFTSNQINAVFKSATGKLWVGTKEGLFFIDQNEKVQPFPLQDQLPNKHVTALYEDQFGALWIGTESGLSKFFDGNISHIVKNDKIDKHIVLDITEDHEGSIWVSTYHSGIYLLNRGKFITYQEEQGVIDDVIYSIRKGHHEGEFIVGTDEGISIYKDGDFFTHRITKHLITPVVKDAFVDSKGVMWVCSKKGLIKSTDQGHTTTVLTTASGLSNDYARQVLEDHQNNIWVGTANGLNVIHPDGSIEKFFMKDGLIDNFILSMYEDSQNQLWICTREGMTTYKDGKFENFMKKNNLKNQIVFKVYEDKEGTIWYGTNNGIFCYKDGSVFEFGNKVIGITTTVFDLVEDKNQTFWVTCNNGIYTVSKRDLLAIRSGEKENTEIKLYNHNDGLASNDATANGVSLKRENGEIWFPTLGGIVVVNPENLYVNPFPPNVLINEVYINNEEQDFKKSNEVTIPAGNERLEIKFTGLSFVAPEVVAFKYKLTGYDEEWIDSRSSRKAFYTNIPPGEYQFEVISCNNDQVWNTNSAKVTIIKLPFWYERPIVQLLILLGLIALVALGYRVRVKQLQAQQVELEQKVEERTIEIKTQADEIQQQAEELQQQAEELEIQRDHLSETNLIISERNQALYDKNEEVSKLIEQVQEANLDITRKNKKVTDSIRYAETMQQAILPEKDLIYSNFSDFFAIFQPKDIVSGDFYWISKKAGDTLFVACVDCTGHGVPGALMSMIGTNLLSKIVNENNIHEPDLILKELDLGIKSALKQEKSNNKDGMDLSVMRIDPFVDGKSKLHFSGAKSFIFYFNREKGELEKINGNRIAIGGIRKKKVEKSFDVHTRSIEKGDRVFLMTDGYIDQCNDERKKFGSTKLTALLEQTVSQSLTYQHNALIDSMKDHQGQTEQRDDITILGIEF
ncbi:two-component regulator propeller domain-containing protein [Flammeovirga sp. SJP92]|uniref:two-component regulator propeller domain-containing protein n=1 Tax=Flammeovirga sp. SJP92 TaxID=1775430 RepID=UPI0009EE8AF7|nr:two-component regulator propeller domain-containing protein [Flammeovirga sp. SJP92]